MLEISLLVMTGLALAGVVFEEVTHVNKAKVTLFFGTLAWCALFVAAQGQSTREVLNHELMENITEIATLWLFLVAAMTFVTYLNRKGLIEHMLNVLMPREISLKKLLFVTALFSFTFSSLADNITATLVCIALVLSLSLAKNHTLRFAVLVVFAVNSGGVSLITGDVTTLMIFTQGKVTITELLHLILPSLMAVLVLASLLCFGLKGRVIIKKHKHTIHTVDYVIAAIFLTTIVATLASNVLFGIPPMLTFLFGLSTMFLVARMFGEDDEQDPILDYIRYIEFDTLLFFLGVLLLVGMLKHIHALDSLLVLYQQLPTWSANYLAGVMSSLVDNVPLTAALLKANLDMPTRDWLGMTYAVGVGGSMLIIGSAAGIVAMSKVKGLTFAAYLKYVPLLLIAYTSGYAMVYAMAEYI